MNFRQPTTVRIPHAAALFLLLFVGGTLSAAPPSTGPVAGIHKARLTTFALVGGKIIVSPGQVIEKGMVVIRDGQIIALGPDVKTPADAQIVDMSGKTLYAGLIDAFSEVALAVNPSDAKNWNANVTPQLDVAAEYKADAAVNKTLRSQGITARLLAPSARIIKGTSAMVTTGDESGRRTILRDHVALHLKLTPHSQGRRSFPGSPMGAFTLVRQSFFDAQWYRDVWKAYRANRQLARPDRDDSLEALHGYLNRQMPVVIDASNELYFLRADTIGREFGLDVIVRGSGNEYRRLDAVVRSGRTVILPVNFPKAPDVSTPDAALAASLEDLMHWDIAPENPGRLEKAGVRIMLTTYGLGKKGTFLAAVRKAVSRGLSAGAALRAMTTTPARRYGVDRQLGTLDVGKMASLLVTDGPLFVEKTKLLETWVDGIRYRHDKDPKSDVRGVWRATIQSGSAKPQNVVVTLTGELDKLKGTLAVGEKNVKLKRASLTDMRLTLVFPGDLLDRKGLVQATVVVSSLDAKPVWNGSGLWPNGERLTVSAERTATHGEQEKIEAQSKETQAKEDGKKDSESTDGDKKKKDNDKKKDDKKIPKPPVKAMFDVNFPLGAFGRKTAPSRPQAVLFRGGTVWTSGPAGLIENGSVLVVDGKIAAVGKNLQTPPGVVVVDVKGKHLTPGIIDCHSHIASDGGINESTQAITAEVRIGDFIDPDDINIYRQLAGGVTSSNILHGSANPIGGQNQVIKMRWGSLPEAMKFAEAPPGIKFALGENVKQSNREAKYRTRYPQSRMGVEQIMLDAFHAAQAYRQRHDAWRRDKSGLPPRVDLELEALSEILAGRRWIHCHSYRQDEILALMRTAELFKIRIGTFQHVLEGYKVADQMAQHGAMGSTFSDWWAYKIEVYDAIPYAGALMHNAGVVVSFNSDDAELGRRLNLEAAKAIKYGNVPPAEALKFVTLNPARQLRIDPYVGSLEVGKQADLVVWSTSPLSIYTRCEQTWIDGRKYFDRVEDAKLQSENLAMHAALVQRILDSGTEMQKPGESKPKESEQWDRTDIYCRARGDGTLRQLNASQQRRRQRQSSRK